MKKYKLKQGIEDIIVCLGIAMFIFTSLSLMSWKFQNLDKEMIEREGKYAIIYE